MPFINAAMIAAAQKSFVDDPEFARQRRRVIDYIATLRARAIRTSLLGRLFYEPGEDEGPFPKAARYALLKEQIDAMNRTETFLRGHDPCDEFAPDILEWVADIALQHEHVVASVSTINKLGMDVQEAALAKEAGEDGAHERLGKAWAKHLAYGRGDFFTNVTAFCDALWTDIENSRKDQIEFAAEASAAILDTLARLEKIGKHVKLVSINAAVEASRAGDAGKGLSVIAVEFKSLAEEIQSLASNARTKITT